MVMRDQQVPGVDPFKAQDLRHTIHEGPIPVSFEIMHLLCGSKSSISVDR